jgi:4-amino-4-deoxy-L-arabinose transferase-like glycosyltransferase
MWRAQRTRTSAEAVSIEQRAGDALSIADRRWLMPLIAIFLLKGLLLVAIIGPFTGHDEVDHFYYVARLAHGEGLGVVGKVKLPPAAAPYQAYVANFPNNAEVIQPPLYHLLLVPLYWLTPGGDENRLYVMRTASLAVGAAVVWLAYLTSRLIFPGELWMRAGVPIAVSLQPQFAFEAAIVNHDILVIALSTLLLYLLLLWYPTGYTTPRLAWLGAIAGAGLWTKASFGLALPVVALAIALAWRERRGRFGDLVRSLLWSCGLALLIATPWFVRSLWYYGDPTGARRLHEIPDYGAQASPLGSMLFSSRFWQGRLEDFWGNYGWRLIPFDPRVYNAVYVIWAVAGLGLLVLVVHEAIAWKRRRPSALSRYQWMAVGLQALWVVLVIAGVLYVGTIQFTQSRFAFPAMVAFALLSVLGLSRLMPRPVRPVLAPTLFVLLMALNVITAVRFLIPYYYGVSGATVLTK